MDGAGKQRDSLKENVKKSFYAQNEEETVDIAWNEGLGKTESSQDIQNV